MPRSDGKARVPRPTDAELAILRVLWRAGPGTVRQVQEEMGGPEQNGYTTVLKMLQIMMEKGLVARDESVWPHVYATTRTEEQTQRQLVGDLLDRAFGGSAAQLVLRALSTRRASPAEIAEVRGMLDELSRRQTKGEKQ